MTRNISFLFACAVAFLGSACGDPHHGNCSGAACDTSETASDDTTGGGDTDSADTIITINPVFGDIAEPCDVTMVCTDADGSTTEKHSSEKPFTIVGGASCAATLGDLKSCHTVDGRPCHTSANGLKWTGAIDLGGDVKNGDVLDIKGDWYFEAARLDCVATGIHGTTAEYVTSDVSVDQSNTFEVNGIAYSGSWFQVSGAQFDFGGAGAEAGYHVSNVTIAPNSISFSYTDIGTYNVSCSW